MNKLLWTTLNTTKAIHALVIDGIYHLARIKAARIVNPVYAFFLYADRAFQTAFFPRNDTGTGDRFKPVGNRFCMYDILFVHL